MHHLEQKLADFEISGTEANISMLGGVQEIQTAITSLSGSPLMPLLLRLLLRELEGVPGTNSPEIRNLIVGCIRAATRGSVWIEAVDLLDESRSILGAAEPQCYGIFAEVARTSGFEPMARSAALDGAFRWSIELRTRQIKLLDLLLDISPEDDPLFLAHAAKICGVTYSHLRESALLDKLLCLAKLAEASDEACFELGMAKLLESLESRDRASALNSLSGAKYWFDQAGMAREHRPDARLYRSCVDLLVLFFHGNGSVGVVETAIKEMSRSSFEMHRWNLDGEKPPWLGCRQVEATCWSNLILVLRGLEHHLGEVTWWEPAHVIEDYVLAAYCANRTLLRRAHDGGVDALVRPRIEQSLAAQHAQLYLLREWLRHNATHEWSEQANQLIENITSITTGRASALPQMAAVESSTAALLRASALPAEAQVAALTAIENAQRLHLHNLSAAEMSLIAICVQAASAMPDYSNNPTAQFLFDGVLVWTLRFLRSRLDMTRAHDSGVSYLFERDDGTLPLERELQADYHRFMFSVISDTEIEVMDVGGGRADVRFTLNGERLVVEVKRENGDCSFEALERSYGAQATDYQNVSIRLGFLLVLDQSHFRNEGTPHMTQLVRAGHLIRSGESDPRCLVTIKVPGRRLRPNELSSTARSTSTRSSGRTRSS